MTSETHPQDQPAIAKGTTRRGVTLWQRVQAFGGFVLACTFFLPAVESCNRPVIPLEGFCEIVQDFPELRANWVSFPAGIVTFAGAYMFGLLVVTAVVLHQTGSEQHTQRVEGIGGSLVLLAALGVLLLFVANVVTSAISSWWPPDWDELIFFLLALVTPMYWLRCLRHGAGGRLALRWYSSLCCMFWFTAWTVLGALYGLHLSLLGSAVIFVGAFEEARLRSSQDRVDTLRALLTATLRVHDDDPTVCPHCGYPRFGLVVPRCPECGTTFELVKSDAPTAQPATR